MTPLTPAQTITMLDLQDRLNVLEDPQWEKQNHLRKAWIATGFLLNVIENVDGVVSTAFADVWMSIMSEWLKCTPKDEDINSSGMLLVATMYDEQYWSKDQQAKLEKYTDLPVLADAFVHLCAAQVLNVHLFERMMDLWNMSWTDMYDIIVPGGMVNVFIGSLPVEQQQDWVYGWAGPVARGLVEDEANAGENVVALLNKIEVAYVTELGRRANATFDPVGQ